jgi:hypothetical protein
MTSFNNIPIKDIDYLLISNGLSTGGNKYETALNFIRTQPNINVITTNLLAHILK